jgi:hypothetical protein
MVPKIWAAKEAVIIVSSSRLTAEEGRQLKAAVRGTAVSLYRDDYAHSYVMTFSDGCYVCLASTAIT